MAKTADLGSKRLVGLAPDNWVQWVTQQSDLTTQDLLESEFQWVGRDTDVLVKVASARLGEFLVLNEFQLRPDLRMPRRMRAYAGLAEERYGCPVYPVVINILPPSGKALIATRYESEWLGLSARQDYRVINLWEIDVSLVFQQPLPSLLPFVPILQGGGNEPIIRRALSDLRTNEQLAEMESLLAFFATFVLEAAVVRDIMRWDMTVLRESPWYQEILQEGEARGRVEGKTEATITMILRFLTRQLGMDTDTWRDHTGRQLGDRLQALSPKRLDALTDVMFDFSSETDLATWLEQFENKAEE